MRIRSSIDEIKVYFGTIIIFHFRYGSLQFIVKLSGILFATSLKIKHFWHGIKLKQLQACIAKVKSHGGTVYALCTPHALRT